MADRRKTLQGYANHGFIIKSIADCDRIAPEHLLAVGEGHVKLQFNSLSLTQLY